MSGKEAEKALADLVDARAPDLAPWLSLIALPLGLEVPESVEVSQLEDQFRPARTLAAIDALLEATVTSPTVLVIEDTHWMDEPSRELLAGLLSGLNGRPWLIVLTRRPGDDGFVAPDDLQCHSASSSTRWASSRPRTSSTAQPRTHLCRRNRWNGWPTRRKDVPCSSSSCCRLSAAADRSMTSRSRWRR